MFFPFAIILLCQVYKFQVTSCKLQVFVFVIVIVNVVFQITNLRKKWDMKGEIGFK